MAMYWFFWCERVLCGILDETLSHKAYKYVRHQNEIFSLKTRHQQIYREAKIGTFSFNALCVIHMLLMCQIMARGDTYTFSNIFTEQSHARALRLL